MDDYWKLEREFIENKLKNELINDIKSISRRDSRQIQNYSRPNNNNRGCFSERYSVPRETYVGGETEKVIITKSGKKRILRIV